MSNSKNEPDENNPSASQPKGFKKAICLTNEEIYAIITHAANIPTIIAANRLNAALSRQYHNHIIKLTNPYLVWGNNVD